MRVVSIPRRVIVLEDVMHCPVKSRDPEHYVGVSSGCLCESRFPCNCAHPRDKHGKAKPYACGVPHCVCTWYRAAGINHYPGEP